MVKTVGFLSVLFNFQPVKYYFTKKGDIMKKNNYYFIPRNYQSIEKWKDVSFEEWNNPLWQLKNSIKTVEQLKQVIELNEYQLSEIERTVRTLKSEGKEPLRITPYYAMLMEKNPFNVSIGEHKLDPIFWQSVPTPAHLLFKNTGKESSMNEGSRSYGAVYQRYPNRVALFVAENTSCASYCTHCQRAKSLDSENVIDSEAIKKGLFYINWNKNIDEVLVTGGDALMINKDKLKFILEELSKIEHLRSIRIATRVPVVMPMGITDELLELIKTASNKFNQGIPKYVYFMTHLNHYHEITSDFAKAVKKIHSYGFSIRNQTVLLNHVNSSFKTLAETFRRMFWTGIEPYYLLQCHKEKGLMHFITPIQFGKIFVKHLQGWLSGVVRPSYAVNIEGGGGKVLLMPSGHDTINTGLTIEDKISDSFATVHTWDSRIISNYEALGRTTLDEFNESVKIMDNFIGKSNVFKPYLIIVDENGKHISTTNKHLLPKFSNEKKVNLLNYELFEGKLITNPAEIENILNDEFYKNN